MYLISRKIYHSPPDQTLQISNFVNYLVKTWRINPFSKLTINLVRDLSPCRRRSNLTSICLLYRYTKKLQEVIFFFANEY